MCFCFLLDEPPKSPLSDKLTTPAVFGHLEELYAIALKHNNSRSVTNGYMASADYVQTLLKKKAHKYCDISTQAFKVPVWSELEAPELSSFGIGSVDSHILYQNKVDFQSESVEPLPSPSVFSPSLRKYYTTMDSLVRAVLGCPCCRCTLFLFGSR